MIERVAECQIVGEIIALRKEIVHGEFLEASVRGTSPHKFIDRSCKTPRRAAWTYVDRTFSPPQVFPRWMESNLWLWLSSIRRCVSSVPRFRIRRTIFSISIRREGGREGGKARDLEFQRRAPGPIKLQLDNYDRKLDTIEWHDRRE